MNVTTKTVIDLEVYKAVTRSATPGFRKHSFRASEILLGSIAVLSLGLGLYLRMTAAKGDPTTFGGLLIIVGAVYALLTVLRLILRRLTPKMQMKAAANLGTRTLICTFGDESFIAEMISDGANSSSEVNYPAVCKVVEDNDYFFIFLTRQSVYPVSKAEMTPEDAEAVREKLASAVGKGKYVSRIK